MIKKAISSLIIRRYKKEAKSIIKYAEKELENKDKEQLLELYNIEKEKKKPSRDIIYALIYEVFKRTLSITPYVVQIVGALTMDDNYMSELKTGEGKTFVTTFVSIYNSLFGKTYNITINDYLSKRDYELTKPVYDYLNIKVAWNEPFHEHNDGMKKQGLYEENDVIFTSSSEFVFDYLKDDANYPMDTVIVDEADFVLIDNANSKFSVSTGKQIHSGITKQEYHNLQIAKKIIKNLKGGKVIGQGQGMVIEEKYDIDFTFSIADTSVGLTTQGIEKIEKMLFLDDLMKHNLLYKAILNMLHVNIFMIKDKDYIIQNKKIVLINRANGRVQPNSTRGEGIQEALEVKESLEISDIHYSKNDISYQLFFSKFNKLVGMSGTIMEAYNEFYNIFDIGSINVPTNEKNQRIDYDDLYFKNKKEKYTYLLNFSKKIHLVKEQPLLIVTESEEESILISKQFKENNLENQVLNAVTTEEEENIIKKAGVKGNITISTNMAGRGTDIKITEEVESLGGLFVISVNKFENIRIDNQVRGRAGRQGEKGACLFLSSMDDVVFQYLKNKDIVYYQNLSSDEFYTEKEQKKLRHKIKKAQKSITRKRTSSRINMFQISQFEDVAKTALLRLGNIIENKKYKGILKKEIINIDYFKIAENNKVHILGESIDLTQKNYYTGNSELLVEDNVLIEKDILDKEKIYNNIIERIDKKIDELGEEISENLLNEIVFHIVKTHWYQVEYDIRYASQMSGMNSQMMPENLSEFIREADKNIESFKHFLIIKAFEMFLIAQIKEDKK